MKILKDSIVLRKPFDMHLHLREGVMLLDVAFFTKLFAGGVVMGNLARPVTTADAVRCYQKEVQAAIASWGGNFQSIMSVMLVHSTTPKILEQAHKAGARVLKLIPGQTSTNSQQGICLSELPDKKDVLQCAAELDMIFSGHWELACDPRNGAIIPEVQREHEAIPWLCQLIEDHPALKTVVEHVSTAQMVNLVKSAPANVGATITSHHLVLTYDMVGEGGQVDPLNYCKPIAKIKADQVALLQAATSGDSKFFFGSDSAPHLLSAKRNGAAGIFSAPVALPLLVQIFEAQKKLPQLEAFTSEFGPRFYGLPPAEDVVTLQRKDWQVPRDYEGIPIFLAGQTLTWQ